MPGPDTVKDLNEDLDVLGQQLSLRYILRSAFAFQWQMLPHIQQSSTR
jgi:hypothetical protein